MLDDIQLISKSGTYDWRVPSKELEPKLQKLCDNFYSDTGIAISEEAMRLWRKHQDRELVESFMRIAYDVEISWRNRNNTRFIVKSLCSTNSYEDFDYSVLSNLSVKQELDLRQQFYTMNYNTFLSTLYWDIMRKDTLRRYNYTCSVTNCMCVDKLHVHHKTYKHARGLEHRFPKDLEVLCEYHHLSEHLFEGGEQWGEVAKKVEPKQL